MRTISSLLLFNQRVNKRTSKLSQAGTSIPRASFTQTECPILEPTSESALSGNAPTLEACHLIQIGVRQCNGKDELEILRDAHLNQRVGNRFHQPGVIHSQERIRKKGRHETRDSIQAACVHHAGPDAPQWLIGMCAALRGKTRADGERLA